LLILDHNLLTYFGQILTKNKQVRLLLATMASAEEKFSFKTLHDGFEACLEDDDDIDIDGYIRAYKELYK